MSEAAINDLRAELSEVFEILGGIHSNVEKLVEENIDEKHLQIDGKHQHITDQDLPVQKWKRSPATSSEIDKEVFEYMCNKFQPVIAVGGDYLFNPDTDTYFPYATEAVFVKNLLDDCRVDTTSGCWLSDDKDALRQLDRMRYNGFPKFHWEAESRVLLRHMPTTIGNIGKCRNHSYCIRPSHYVPSSEEILKVDEKFKTFLRGDGGYVRHMIAVKKYVDNLYRQYLKAHTLSSKNC